MKIAFIIKNNIKRKRKVYDTIAAVENLNLFEQCESYETNYAKHAIELARTVAQENYTYIIAVGGDGTVNEVVNGMMQARENAGDISHQPILGHLPYGTANDFCRTAELTNSTDTFIQLLENQTCSPIDVGSVVNRTLEGERQEQYFLNVTDAGIGGYVVEKVNSRRKYLGPGFTFFRAITESFFTYEQTKVKCIADEFTWEGKILTISVNNGKYFGSGLCIAPDASLDDGVFEVVIIGEVKTRDYLMEVRKMRKQKRMKHPKINYFRAKELEIIPQEYSCALDMDGEFIGYAPAVIKIIPKAIQLLYKRNL